MTELWPLVDVHGSHACPVLHRTESLLGIQVFPSLMNKPFFDASTRTLLHKFPRVSHPRQKLTMSPYEVLPPQSKPEPELSGTVEELLEQFEISQHGFLPKDAPLGRLPDPYFAPWESLMQNLPDLLSSRTLRKHADQLPILSTTRLATDAEQRRAYVVLCFLAHAYIWGGDTASDASPPRPFYSSCSPTNKTRPSHHPFPSPSSPSPTPLTSLP
jgi:hypothetical protein